MKKYIILILSLLINIMAYSKKNWGNDRYSILTAETTIGKMENVIAGSSRRKLTNSEAIVVTLNQKWHNKVKNIRIKSLPLNNSVDFNQIKVGKIYDFKYYFNGREINIGDTIEFPDNSNKIEIKILGIYSGYIDFYHKWFEPNNAYTEWLGNMKLEYDVPYYNEQNRQINISYLYYETHVIRKIKVDVSGKMDFGQVVAGELANADVDVDVYFYNDKSTYKIPDSMNIENSNGDTLQVNLSSAINNYSGWDSHSRIKIYGSVKTKKDTPSGKYKGSFYVKFRFK